MLDDIIANKDSQYDLVKLDRVLMNDGVPNFVKKYYYLANLYYLNSPDYEYKEHLKFLNSASDFSKHQNYQAFEVMVNTMAKNTNTAVAAEAWDDPTMDIKEEAAVTELTALTTAFDVIVAAVIA